MRSLAAIYITIVLSTFIFLSIASASDANAGSAVAGNVPLALLIMLITAAIIIFGYKFQNSKAQEGFMTQRL